MLQTTSTLSIQCSLLFIVALSVLLAVEPTAIGLFPGSTNCGVTIDSKQNELVTFHRSFDKHDELRISERQLVDAIKRRDKTMEDLQRVNETLWKVDRAMDETKLAIIRQRKWKYLMDQRGLQPLPKWLEHFCKVTAETHLSLVWMVKFESPEERLLRLKKTRNELLCAKDHKEAILKKSNGLLESAQCRLVIVLPTALPNDRIQKAGELGREIGDFRQKTKMGGNEVLLECSTH